MDSPVSAFAVYKSKTQQNESKKKRRKEKKNKPVASPTIPTGSASGSVSGDLMKEIGLKFNEQQKKGKESKNITKKKSHKKKKSKKGIKKLKITTKMSKRRPESDAKPKLKHFQIVQASFDDDKASYSSNGSFELPVQTDSAEEGLKVFQWMIAPFNAQDFLNEIWEKKPLHISRKKTDYYNKLISTPSIDTMLREENIQYTKNIDLTSYVDGERATHNPDGRAHAHSVWDSYLNGHSIRLLNPQTYMPRLHLLNAALQEFFNSFVGANAYLTPPDSQGFAPHYDDIEAFILQTEGKKHWCIYKPRHDSEILPRTSSRNFSDNEIGEPILEVTLEAGDMLYFPRGYIHQAVTIDGEHSLHVTVSMYQKHAWADLFEKMIPAALQIAIDDNIEFRHGLPFDIYDNFGLVHSDMTTPRKIEIKEIVERLFDKIKECLPIDDAVDQMSKKYQQDALPPVLSDSEKALTVFGSTDRMVENGFVTDRVEISMDTRIRLLRKNILRMISEDSIRLYYNVENSLEYHGSEVPFLEIDEDMAPAIETLITSYPEYVTVEYLNVPNDSDKLQIADALWSRGLIMTEYPLEFLNDD